MKRFAIVCALVLLLNVLCPVGHMHAEEISTPSDVSCEHWRYCDGAENCGACEEPYEGENVKHVGPVEWKYDATSHWQECAECYPATGNKMNVAEHDSLNGCSVCGYACAHENCSEWLETEDGTGHYRNCLDCGMSVDPEDHFSDGNPGWCAYCGASFADCENGGHKWAWACDNEGYHWEYCIGCQETQYREKHFTYCDQPDKNVCIVCGEKVADDLINLEHTVMEDSTWEWDEYNHWLICVCGEEKCSNWGHSKSCQADACEDCGYTGEILNSGGGVYHNYDGKYEYDEHFHWGVCVDCGEGEDFQFFHVQQDCKSDICQVCGATFDNDQHYGYPDEYEYDETGHWFTCTDCGDKTETQSHYYICDDPTSCTTCGYKPSGTVNVSHLWTEKYTDCGDYHAKICPECGEETWAEAHVVKCTNPGVCVTCGATNVSTETMSHTLGDYEYDETNHWRVCSDCEQKCYVTEHNASCDEPGVCSACGAKNDSIKTNDHNVFDSEVYHDETNHWRVCNNCNEKVYVNLHFEYCYDVNGICNECGYTENIEIRHQALKVGYESDTENHWKVCAVCEEVVSTEAHADEGADCKCDICGADCAQPECEHTWKETSRTEATCVKAGAIKYTCGLCNETKEETIAATGEHTWGEPVTVKATCVAAGSKTTVCTVCSEKTVETIPATDEHTWETVSKTYATCTKAGRTERVCTVCDELSITTQGAKGHAYGLVFVTEGNGTHAKTCADCGAKHVESCELTSTEMGDMVCSACATCGYAVYTMTDVALEEVEDLTEAKAEIEVKRVENVSFEIAAEPAEEGAETETIDTADVVLVVHETELEMKVELPDTVNADVKKVLAVSMLKEGSAIQPSGKVKLSIPVVEEEVVGLKLVLMGENGELIEIEYEIIAGVIVFETDMVGIFLFVEAEA